MTARATRRPANPEGSLTQLRKGCPSTVTTSSAKHGGISCGTFATTDFGVTRLSITRPYSPQSSHASTYAECEVLNGFGQFEVGVMSLNHATAEQIARDYVGATGPLHRLGWGIGGYVYLSPDGRTAVKVHRHEAGFVNEVEAYFRLRRVRTSQLHGITIPKVHDARLDLKLIRMDFVTPPFLVAGHALLIPSVSARGHPPGCWTEVLDAIDNSGRLARRTAERLRLPRAGETSP